MESSSMVDGDGGLARGGLHGVLIPISLPARVVVDFSSRIGWRWKADMRSARFRLVTASRALAQRKRRRAVACGRLCVQAQVFVAIPHAPASLTFGLTEKGPYLGWAPKQKKF